MPTTPSGRRTQVAAGGVDETGRGSVERIGVQQSVCWWSWSWSWWSAGGWPGAWRLELSRTLCCRPGWVEGRRRASYKLSVVVTSFPSPPSSPPSIAAPPPTHPHEPAEWASSGHSPSVARVPLAAAAARCGNLGVPSASWPDTPHTRAEIQKKIKNPNSPPSGGDSRAVRAGWRPVQEFNCSGALRVGESPPPRAQAQVLRAASVDRCPPWGKRQTGSGCVCVCVCVRVCVQGEEQRGRGSILDFGK